jgi:hypothetical protein
MLAPREQNVGDLGALVSRHDAVPAQHLRDLLTIPDIGLAHATDSK